MRAFKTMLKIEWKLSLRGMDMVLFSICLPVVMVILLGILFGGKPALEGSDYTFLEQSFGAVSTIGICAAGVMGLPLLISDYRHKKILKRFQVTPVHPVLILFVPIVVYLLYSLLSLLSIYIVAKVFFDYHFRGSFPVFLGSYLFVIFSMFGIGILVGGVAPNREMASILASIFYFPMLIFSGATLPYEIMPVTMQKAVDFLPLTQGIKLLKTISLGLSVEMAIFPFSILCVLATVCYGAAIRFFKWE